MQQENVRARVPGLERVGPGVHARRRTFRASVSPNAFRYSTTLVHAAQRKETFRDVERARIKPVTPQTQGNSGILHRPDRPEVIVEWMIGGMGGGEGTDSPAAPEVRFEEASHHARDMVP